ncbi:MAG: cytochrome c [Gammaproteobacteria bacterium]|nr:cytochrome c [Gammaproteobacteria bacterium]
MRKLGRWWLFALGLLTVAPLGAEEFNAQRARFNYQMSCQGCHAPDGVGASTVPRMKDFVGTFLRSRAGREFLVRVPGAATSALGDAELAEVLNWILLDFGGDSVKSDFRRYTGTEVGALRKSPLFEVDRYRVQLLAEIASNTMENQSHD